MESLQGAMKDVAVDGVISISPLRCRMWALHDRLEEYVNERNCRAEIESFARHGQLIPVLGRPLLNDREFDVELIYGARRLFVARHLNVPLRVRLSDISDRDALIAMEIENRQRRDISPYERGLSYGRWIRGGNFASQDEIATALKISPSVVSKLLKLARLPAVIVNAFATPGDIPEGWGLELMDAWDDQQRRPLLARRARSLSMQNPRPSGRIVYETLMSADVRSSVARRHRSGVDVVYGDSGRPLFRIQRQRRFVVFAIPNTMISVGLLGELRSAICRVLQGAAQVREMAEGGNSARTASKESPGLHTAGEKGAELRRQPFSYGLRRRQDPEPASTTEGE
jgi:ParB family chromosome partitioning protein